MKKLLRDFLNENIPGDYSNDKFDYSFDIKSSLKKFKIEFQKFLGLYNSYFYNNNRFVTVINSYEVRLKKEDINHLFKLYIFADSKKLNYERTILLEFLYTYFKSITTTEYKQNCKNYDEVKKDFKSILENYNLSKSFFTKSIDIIFDFYEQLLNYGIRNKVFIDQEIINRIFNNLNGNIDNQNYDKLVDVLVNNKINLYGIVKFDHNINRNINIYLSYILESITEFGGYSYVNDMISILDKKKYLNKENIKKIINKYVEVTNILCRKLEGKKYSFIQGLAEINDLKKQLISVLENVESLSDLQKEKINECLSYLLRLKRYMISDENYANSDMHEFSIKENIPIDEIEKFKNSLLKNSFLLYSASKMRFTTSIGNALESYAKYPLQSIVTIYHIDSSNQVYSVGLDKKRSNQDNFKKYYDMKGKEYTNNHRNLINKLNKDYYEEMLRYLSKTFFIQQNLVLSFLGKENFDEIINELKKNIHYNFDNKYAIVVSNILAIETNIIKVLENKKMDISSDGFENINALFESYEEEDKKDGLMYINYILYEKSGLNLRNSMMHGNMINKNLDIALLVTFSGLIFVSWLLNDKQ